jgi:hypothetical protein
MYGDVFTVVLADSKDYSISVEAVYASAKPSNL